jgi:ABC transport permease subunit
MGIVAHQICRRLLRLDFDREELMRNLYKMGVKSVPIVVLTALFTGATMVVVQAAPIVERYGAQGLLGWGAGFGILREVGPVLTALMISGRVGANNTAELGTMTVTEQIDALRALAIDPIAFLIVPRLRWRSSAPPTPGKLWWASIPTLSTMGLPRATWVSPMSPMGSSRASSSASPWASRAATSGSA